MESLWEASFAPGVVMPVPLLLEGPPPAADSPSLEVSNPPMTLEGRAPCASMDPLPGRVSAHTRLSCEDCARGNDGRRFLAGAGSAESVVPELNEPREGEDSAEGGDGWGAGRGGGGGGGGGGRIEVWREDGWRGRWGRTGCGWKRTVDLAGGLLASGAMGGGLGAGGGGVAGAACGSRCVLSARGAGAGMAMAATMAVAMAAVAVGRTGEEDGGRERVVSKV